MCEKNRDFLYLIWKDPRSRRNFTVGKLSRGDTYSFEYCEEYERAKEVGWEFLKSFPEDRVYKSPSLFAAFASRLPDPKRRNIEDILQKYGLSEYDAYELLRKSTGRLPIDTYEFVDPIFPDDQTVEKEFYIVGIRHASGCCGKDCGRLPVAGLGDELVLQLEPENEHDEFAVAAYTQRGEMLGYVPRYYSESVSTRLGRGMTYTCRVIEVNEKDHDCENCLKVLLKMPKRQ